jgi:ParB family chromosome partitioning protein
MSEKGHIELERRIDSLVIGDRHRKDPGDLDALMRSIQEVGLLQPITVTPDGVLVCGWRRLEAVRRLGWRTLKVWVRSGISDRLSELLAQQDENAMRKPLSPLEATELYLELKKLHAEDGARRQTASRIGATGSADGAAEENGAAHCAAPERGDGDSRAQAARMVTGDRSYNRFERIAWLERVAADHGHSPAIRELATRELRDIEAGAPVMPGYSRVKAAIEVAAAEAPSSDDLEALAAAALARVREEQSRSGVRALKRSKDSVPKHRTLRSFILTWTELDGWSQHYDPAELAGSLKDDEWERFERVVAETVSFAEVLRNARALLASA